RSSELIHSGELTRIVRPGKTQQRSYFLFDHQLVFCKKDVLRRDLLHYRGRMDTDLLEPVDLPDGRHAEMGLLKNAFLLRHAENLNVLTRTSSDGCKRLLESADGYRKTKRW
ncbi:hypothetical protein M9458_047938, partial [Cirrhinus mrigala]